MSVEWTSFESRSGIDRSIRVAEQELRGLKAVEATNRGQMKSIESEERLKQLKRDIALSAYDVDARVVADAIIAKLRLVKRCREAISVEADRSHEADQPERRFPGG